MRNIVQRPDGRRIHVARSLGQLFVCAEACCCGRVQDGYAAVPRDLYHSEWERRGLRNRVHLTIGGCLGPCALANVAMLIFDGRQAWFHSMSSDEQVLALYDWIEELVRYRNRVIELLREKAQLPDEDAPAKRRNPMAHSARLGDVGALTKGDDDLLAGVDPHAHPAGAPQ